MSSSYSDDDYDYYEEPTETQTEHNPVEKRDQYKFERICDLSVELQTYCRNNFILMFNSPMTAKIMVSMLE
jgi:hypothetical protein